MTPPRLLHLLKAVELADSSHSAFLARASSQPCSITQEGQVYQGTGVGVGSLVQQQFGDTVVAAVSSHMQGGQVVQCHVIHGSLVLQQVLDTFHVVPLGCHVEWGQSILWPKRTEQQFLVTFASTVACIKRTFVFVRCCSAGSAITQVSSSHSFYQRDRICRKHIKFTCMFSRCEKEHTEIVFQVWNSLWKQLGETVLVIIYEGSENMYQESPLRSDWSSFHISVYYSLRKQHKGSAGSSTPHHVFSLILEGQTSVHFSRIWEGLCKKTLFWIILSINTSPLGGQLHSCPPRCPLRYTASSVEGYRGVPYSHRAHTHLGPCQERGTSLQEQLHHLVMATSCRTVQWGESILKVKGEKTNEHIPSCLSWHSGEQPARNAAPHMQQSSFFDS